MNARIHEFRKASLLSEALLGLISDQLKKRRPATGPATFYMGLSGGSVLDFLGNEPPSPNLGELASRLDGSSLRIYPIDERHVPFDHPQSNAGQIHALLERPVSRQSSSEGEREPRRHSAGAIQENSAGEALLPYPVDKPLQEAALLYENLLRSIFGGSQGGRQTGILGQEPETKSDGLDLLLLGAGGDGHIASLFPGSRELEERDRWVVPVTDSPKPPKERLSMTLPFLARSKRAVLVLTKVSTDKRDLYERIASRSNPTPGPGGADEPLPVECLLEALQDRIEIWTLD